jgi:1-deoxy-D-xylulose-5-phosphate reductoisomerase
MHNAVKRIAILGSTGSIGCNSFEVIDALGPKYQPVAASANTQWQKLAQQARQYHLEKVILTDPVHIADLRHALSDTTTEVLSGPEALTELACDPEIDILIVAVVGAAALPAVLAATQAGKTIAIANKESLVVAGCLLMPMARQFNATILPIDSEHSAILQAMHSGRPHEVEKIIITASGGPFRRATAQQIASATLADALNHPTWNMGPKITIDSATMMNKALEIIEARWLFDLDPNRIEVLIHPESIIHSLVEFCDGSIIAQMSNPDMRLPIQYALTYPNRLPCPTRRLDLQQLRQLNFEPPDFKRFPAVRLGFEVARRGGAAGAVLNAANEAAVAAFRQGKIPFTRIAELAEQCLQDCPAIENPTLRQLLDADRAARQIVQSSLKPKQLQNA